MTAGQLVETTRRHVLVTGGAGFIGSHLCERLLSQGFQVTCIDDFSSGSPDNVKGCSRNPSFTFYRHNIEDLDALDLGDVSAVVHLACPASPADYLARPIETLRTGSIGTLKVVEYAATKEARLVYASTSEVYGDPTVHPQPEDYWGNVNPIGPRSVYDEAKRFGESVVSAYTNCRGLDAGIVRIFNVYGPRMRASDGRVVPSFISQSLAGEDITVNGTGLQTRSFCYIDDMVDAIILMLHSDSNGPINLGNPEEVTILELANLIRSATASGSQVIHRAKLPDDPERRKPEIDLARSILGWVPRVTLKQGLSETIKWFEETAPYSAHHV